MIGAAQEAGLPPGCIRLLEVIKIHRAPRDQGVPSSCILDVRSGRYLGKICMLPRRMQWTPACDRMG